MRGEAAAVDYLSALAVTLDLVPSAAIGRAIQLLLDARETGNRIYLMGNGGSAAAASRLACDLSKTAFVEGFKPLRAFALTDNVPSFTAWANDTSYERVFGEQIEALVEPGDVVIAISASGNSPNILRGLQMAAKRGARTIGLLGFEGGEAKALVEVAIHIPVNDYGLAEDVHLALGHALSRAIQGALSSGSDRPG